MGPCPDYLTAVLAMDKQEIITKLQSYGLRLGSSGNLGGRRGGAGPSDHRAVTVEGTTVMVPIHTGTARQSPYVAEAEGHQLALIEDPSKPVATIDFPAQPRFYQLTTADGVPYWKIALLHGRDVLATTVQQTCKRYRDPATACQFCAIEQSLQEGRTLARKTPDQLAEVAEAAVRLDGVSHMVMTTGTPPTLDRGAAYLADCARAVKARVNLPIQAQCEPPADFQWFEQMRRAGVDSLGMHLEVVEPEVRAQIMPGKAEVTLSDYFEAFKAAVEVFGWGQVSSYLLVGLGDSVNTLVEISARLIDLGVYPFLVPFVPISGTPLAGHPAPSPELMQAVYRPVAALLGQTGMTAAAMQAGCAKCGACSALSLFEQSS
jgi:radical SAM protein (TIGR04043 family)